MEIVRYRYVIYEIQNLSIHLFIIRFQSTLNPDQTKGRMLFILGDLNMDYVKSGYY